MANLMRLKRAGIPCPHVVTLKKHVLVMSFIGKDNNAAPKLKDALMKDVDYIVAYDEVTFFSPIKSFIINIFFLVVDVMRLPGRSSLST